MEPVPIREEIHNFTRACQALAGFAHAHTGLTALERETVSNFVRALEEEVGPFAPASSPDDPPLAATLSNLPPID
jgi:hypothetical protein